MRITFWWRISELYNFYINCSQIKKFSAESFIHFTEQWYVQQIVNKYVIFFLEQVIVGIFRGSQIKLLSNGAGTSYPSGALEFTTGFYWGSCYSIFSFMCMFCRSLFVLFLLATVLSVLLRYTDSDCPFGIFKLFLCLTKVWLSWHFIKRILVVKWWIYLIYNLL